MDIPLPPSHKAQGSTVQTQRESQNDSNQNHPALAVFAIGLLFLVPALVLLLSVFLKLPKLVLQDGFLIHIGLIRKVALDLRDLGQAHLRQYRINLSKRTTVLFFTANEEAAMLHANANLPITPINASKQHDISVQTGNDLAKAPNLKPYTKDEQSRPNVLQ